MGKLNQIQINGIELVIGRFYRINGETYRLDERNPICNSFKFVNIKGKFAILSVYDLLNARFELEPHKGFRHDLTTRRLIEHLTDQCGLGENVYSPLIGLKVAENLPRKVFFNDKKKATTLLYGDEATVVKTCKGDKYDREKGFLMAFFQKQSGLSKTQVKKYLKKITEEK